LTKPDIGALKKKLKYFWSFHKKQFTTQPNANELDSKMTQSTEPTQPTQLFPAMFECICRGNGITFEEGIAMLNKHFAVRGCNDDIAKQEQVKEVPQAQKELPQGEKEEFKQSEPQVQKKTVVMSKKEKKPKYEKPNVILPWTGKGVDTWCQGLRVNHQLLSQCTMKPKKDGFCTTCLKQVEEKGQPKCGTVAMRIEADKQKKAYKNPENGKEAVKFADVMNKLKITKESAVAEATKFGLVIPDDEFVATEKKKGRPKKAKTSAKADTLSAIINQVVAASDTSSSEGENELEIPVTPNVPQPPTEIEGKTEEPSSPFVLAPPSSSTILSRRSKSPEPEPVPEPEAEPVVETKEQELKTEEPDSDYDAETEDEDDSTEVTEWSHGGVDYLIDAEGVVYDKKSQEVVGVYNKETDTINQYVEESSDEEEDNMVK